jgi:hypothetical protein
MADTKLRLPPECVEPFSFKEMFFSSLIAAASQRDVPDAEADDFGRGALYMRFARRPALDARRQMIVRSSSLAEYASTPLVNRPEGY